MSDNFKPSTSIVSIKGSSYKAQFGTIDDEWNIRIYRGNTEVATALVPVFDVESLTHQVGNLITIKGINLLTIRKTLMKLMKILETGEEPTLSPPPQATSPKPQTYQPTLLSEIGMKNQTIEENEEPENSQDQSASPPGSFIPEATVKPSQIFQEPEQPPGIPVSSLPKAEEPSSSPLIEKEPESPKEETEPPASTREMDLDLLASRVATAINPLHKKPSLALWGEMREAFATGFLFASQFVHKKYGKPGLEEFHEYYVASLLQSWDPHIDTAFPNRLNELVDWLSSRGVSYNLPSEIENQVDAYLSTCTLEQGLKNLERLEMTIEWGQVIELCLQLTEAAAEKAGISIQITSAEKGYHVIFTSAPSAKLAL